MPGRRSEEDAMKHYEIIIENRNYPLTYRCSTIAEAFGCLMEVSGWASHVRFDPDGLMETLVSMRFGKTISHNGCGYYISVKDGEV